MGARDSKGSSKRLQPNCNGFTFIVDTDEGTVSLRNRMGTTHKVVRDDKTGEIIKTEEKTQAINSKTMSMSNVKKNDVGSVSFSAQVSAGNRLSKSNPRYKL